MQILQNNNASSKSVHAQLIGSAKGKHGLYVEVIRADIDKDLVRVYRNNGYSRNDYMQGGEFSPFRMELLLEYFVHDKKENIEGEI